MIISASYKTDIPAFYGEWFMRRLRSGFVGMANPYNRQLYRISLRPEDVSGYVFWTKNLRPFLKNLREVAAQGRPAYVQFTINGYPRQLETAVVDWRKSILAAEEARDILGARSIVWRYDPVILSHLTPWPWHVESFQRIADALGKVTDEVVISFVQLYRKTKFNLDVAAETGSNPWWSPQIEEQRSMATELYELAAERGIRLTICSQPGLITVQQPSRCIDATRLSDLAGRQISATTKGNRPGCECAESKDIGDYDTCPHGCVYCYAVRSQQKAIERFQMHSPDSEFLFPIPEGDSARILTVNRDLQHRLDV